MPSGNHWLADSLRKGTWSLRTANPVSREGECSSIEGAKSDKMLLLLLSHVSRVRLCATPQTAARQAPPSLGFSSQAYWSELPFPSPMHACMLSHFSRVQLCVTPWTAAHQAPLSTGFSRQEYLSGSDKMRELKTMEGLEQGRSVLFIISVGSPPEISGVHSQLSIPDRRHPPFSPAERANPGLRLLKKSYFFNLFFGCVGSLLLCMGFL